MPGSTIGRYVRGPSLRQPAREVLFDHHVEELLAALDELVRR
jgi:hypothetical protein